MNARVCKFCGGKFWSKGSTKKYCSYKCIRSAAKEREQEREQLCCSCKNACGGCNWSRHFLPVAGWDAVPTIVKDREGDINSYKISGCPEYIPMRNE